VATPPDLSGSGKIGFSVELRTRRRKFYWKIDLYEKPGVKDENGDPAVDRVLTLMLADEW
jgi:hypothetical protein